MRGEMQKAIAAVKRDKPALKCVLLAQSLDVEILEECY